MRLLIQPLKTRDIPAFFQKKQQKSYEIFETTGASSIFTFKTAQIRIFSSDPSGLRWLHEIGRPKALYSNELDAPTPT